MRIGDQQQRGVLRAADKIPGSEEVGDDWHLQRLVVWSLGLGLLGFEPKFAAAATLANLGVLALGMIMTSTASELCY